MSVKFVCDWCGTDITEDGTEPLLRLEYQSPNRQQMAAYDFDSLDHMRQKIAQVQQTGVL